MTDSILNACCGSGAAGLAGVAGAAGGEDSDIAGAARCQPQPASPAVLVSQAPQALPALHGTAGYPSPRRVTISNARTMIGCSAPPLQVSDFGIPDWESRRKLALGPWCD